MDSNVYIGSIIRQKVDESRYSVTQFAEEIGLTRPSAYNLFKKKSVDIDLLFRISKLLNYNFLDLYFEGSEICSITKKIPNHTS